MRLDSVFELIRAERHEQTRRWGHQVKSREGWLALLTEEFLEYARAVNDCENEARVNAELVQIAALCCQILEG